jgi:hypothetical protein
MNFAERFFANLTADVTRTGSFASVGELVRDIEAYLDGRYANPRPYKWQAKGEAGTCCRYDFFTTAPYRTGGGNAGTAPVGFFRNTCGTGISSRAKWYGTPPHPG